MRRRIWAYLATALVAGVGCDRLMDKAETAALKAASKELDKHYDALVGGATVEDERAVNLDQVLADRARYRAWEGDWDALAKFAADLKAAGVPTVYAVTMDDVEEPYFHEILIPLPADPAARKKALAVHDAFLPVALKALGEDDPEMLKEEIADSAAKDVGQKYLVLDYSG